MKADKNYVFMQFYRYKACGVLELCKIAWILYSSAPFIKKLPFKTYKNKVLTNISPKILKI